MNSVGNVKLTQLKKILPIFLSNLIQILTIFGAMEDSCFEFTNLSCFGNLDKNQTRQGHLSVPVSRLPRSDCVPGVQTVTTTILPLPPVLTATLPSPPVSAVYKAHEWPSGETLSHFTPSPFSLLALLLLLPLCTAAVLPSLATVWTMPSSPRFTITRQ
jgi:hypothetical protein